MRFQALPTLVLLAAAALLAGQTITPFNVQTGQWQVHQQVTLSGDMPVPPGVQVTPQMRAQAAATLGPTNITYTSCVTPESLSENPFPPPQSSDTTCTETVENSTGTDLRVHIVCSGEISGNGHLALHAVDSQHVTAGGDGTITAYGKTLNDHMTVTATWVSATCKKGSH